MNTPEELRQAIHSAAVAWSDDPNVRPARLALQRQLESVMVDAVLAAPAIADAMRSAPLVPSRTITPSGWGWEWKVSESCRADKSGHAFTKRTAIRKSALFLAVAVDRYNESLGRM